MKVFIMQFLKGRMYSEIRALKGIKNITLEQCGGRCFIKKKPGMSDIKCAEKGLARSEELILSGKYDHGVLRSFSQLFMQVASHAGD